MKSVKNNFKLCVATQQRKLIHWFCCLIQCKLTFLSGEGRMPSFECATDSSSKFETDALSAHPV